MAFTDFLFNGSAPPSVNQYGSSSSNLPTWYSDYTQGLIAKSNAIASQPYQAYGGARIAAPTQNMQNAWEQTEQNANNWQQNLGFNQAQDTLGNLQQTGNNAAVASQPYQADQQRFLNPIYQSMDRLGAEKLGNTLSGISDQFTAGGQFGGSRMGQAGNAAARGAAADIAGQKAQLAQQAYGTALGAGQQDLARQQSSATAQGALGQLQSGVGVQQASALDAAGQEQQASAQKNLDLAYSDFQNQKQYPYQQASFLNNIIQGIQVPTQTSTTQTGPASSYQASPLAQLGALGTGIAGISKLFG